MQHSRYLANALRTKGLGVWWSPYRRTDPRWPTLARSRSARLPFGRAACVRGDDCAHLNLTNPQKSSTSIKNKISCHQNVHCVVSNDRGRVSPRQARYFLLLRQKISTQRKGDPIVRVPTLRFTSLRANLRHAGADTREGADTGGLRDF